MSAEPEFLRGRERLMYIADVARRLAQARLDVQTLIECLATCWALHCELEPAPVDGTLEAIADQAIRNETRRFMVGFEDEAAAAKWFAAQDAGRNGHGDRKRDRDQRAAEFFAQRHRGAR